MLAAADAHRDNIQKMTAIPPLFIDDTKFSFKFVVPQQKREQKTFNGNFRSLRDRIPIVK
jgi:hypothetical protein